MDLFVRDSGPAGAPAIVFLHGGRTSGWAWEPVVERLPGYRCLVPDLPGFGKSVPFEQFDISAAAEAVAAMIGSRVGVGRSHVVGFSLGAQVALQLLAAAPHVVDRAVLSGAVVNTLPFPQVSRFLARLVAQNRVVRRVLTHRWNARSMAIPSAYVDAYRSDLRLLAGAQLAQIASASAGFTVPVQLASSHVPTLFVTGGAELPPAHLCADVLARRMPEGVCAVAVGMRHDWPLRCPVLFGHTIEAWLTGAALPHEIVRA